MMLLVYFWFVLFLIAKLQAQPPPVDASKTVKIIIETT